MWPPVSLKVRCFKLCKCVCGLMDASRKWWESSSKTLLGLGMKQSELDPCVFMWFDPKKDSQLGGILALHVDDMVCGGCAAFMDFIEELRRE